jgi:gamma-glutamyltranspeptidase/glutathione hydrolase
MPPSSSGGVTLAQAANILETFPLPELRWHSAREIHLLAEAWKRAFADRNHYLTDPDFAPMPLDVLTSDEYARARASSIGERATPSAEVTPGVEAFAGTGLAAAPRPTAALREGMNTTHLSVVDRFGNAVAITTTINSLFGSGVTVTGAGFLLNNEMDDFSARPGTPNQFGLVQGERNAIEPGKRMLSAMTPTVVLDPRGELFLVTGTPGGPTIITTVLQVLSNVVDHGMTVGRAVVAPRVHHQHLPDRIEFEPGGLPPDVVAELRALGHTVREDRGYSGDVQAIRVRPDGALEGFSDPRRGGRAIGY